MFNNTQDFCGLFFSATNIPIAYYSNIEILIASFSSLDPSLVLNIRNTLFYFMKQAAKNPYAFFSNSQGFYGIVRLESTAEYIIIGPVFNIPVSDNMIREYIHENAISINYRENVTQFLRNTPILSYYQFLTKLQLLYFCLNGVKISIFDYIGLTVPKYDVNIASQHSRQSFEKKETLDFHDTYLFEQRMLDYVINGETEKLKNFLISSVNTTPLKEGFLADSPLRQAKNIFIGVASMIGKQGAIAGGLDVEQVYQLIDLYTQECEKFRTIEDITNLQLTMVLDFCERVRQNHIPAGFTNEIFECLNFITKNTNVTIQISDVARHVGKSTSYISNKFKQELGFTIGAFIMRCKLEEAKSLLTHSNKSISEISTYLCFSSQSYFQNVFKKKYGITPAHYRKKK